MSIKTISLENRDYWRRDDVLSYLKIGRNALAAWIKDKGFPEGQKIGGRYLYWKRTEVLAWMEAQTEKQVA